MPCTTIRFANGTAGIICTRRGRPRRCACGRTATRECDWKVPGKKSGTCDRPICTDCSHVPAPEKDLCPEHTVAWKAWQAARAPSAEASR